MTPTKEPSAVRAFLCWLGLHPHSTSTKYLGMTKGRRNWLGVRIYKSFLFRFRCPSCDREYQKWT